MNSFCLRMIFSENRLPLFGQSALPARSRSLRRSSASAYSVFSAKVVRNRATVSNSLREMFANSRSLTRRRNGASSVSAASPAGVRLTRTPRRSRSLARLLRESLGDQPPDLGGDVGGRELHVVGERADRHAVGLLAIGGADQHRELRAGERDRPPERLAARLQAAEGKHHEVERLAEGLVVPRHQQRGVRDSERGRELAPRSSLAGSHV